MQIPLRWRPAALPLFSILAARTVFASAVFSTLMIAASFMSPAYAQDGQAAQRADAAPRATRATPHGGRHRPRHSRADARRHPAPPATLDRSGKPRRGKASYYGGPRFAGKTMADGTPMNPKADIAASKTLPLGTKARVTNLANGKSATVTIRDRGPYVAGRIVDVSPKVAAKLNMKSAGVAPVVVAPIVVPQADGSLKPGSGTVQDFSGHALEDTRTADARQPGHSSGSDDDGAGAAGASSEAPTASGND